MEVKGTGLSPHSNAFVLIVRKHVAIAEGIVRHEQIPCIAFVIEVKGEITHHVVQIVALADNVLGKILLRIKFSHVMIPKVGEIRIARPFIVGIKHLTVILIQFAVFRNIVE